MSQAPLVRRLATLDDAQIHQLSDVLIDCVAGGASINFMHPLSPERASAFWHRMARAVVAQERAILVATDERGICGTVQLVLDMPENQPHRADVAKMLVHRRARRRGVGEALMRAAEGLAVELGRTLLVLDTASGREASRLYERLGWIRVGDIPSYALFPEGGLTATTFYYRDLGADGRRPTSR